MANRYQERSFPADDHFGRQDGYARNGGESDPLAELARLIGQADPLSSFAKNEQGADQRRAPVDFDAQLNAQLDQYDEPEDAPAATGRPSWMRRSNVVEAPPEPEVAIQPIHPLHRHGRTSVVTPQPAPLPSAPAIDDYVEPYHEPEPMAAAYNPDAGRYDEALFGKMPEPQQHAHHDDYAAHHRADHADDYDDQDYDDMPKRRGGMRTVAIVMALAVVGTGAALAYRTFTGGPSRAGEPPIIRADASPNKLVPPSASSDGSKAIQDRLAAGQERIVSREEQPVDVQRVAVDQPRVVFPPTSQPSAAQQQAAPSVTGALNSNAAAASISDEPRRVRTLTVRGEADQTTTPAARQAPARITAPAAANAPIALTPQPATRVASTAPTAAAVTGGYVVQVASQRGEAEAQASFNFLKSKYPSVLGSRSATIRRADLGDRGVYYRAMVGPFNSQDAAGQFCNSLRSAGGQCVVQRN